MIYMMKRCLIILLVVSLFPHIFRLDSTVHAQKKNQVLLVYDSLAIGSSNDGNIDALKRLLGAFAVEVTTVDMSQYESGMAHRFSHLIVLRNKANFANDMLQEDIERYNGSYLHIGFDPPPSLAKALGLQTEKEARSSLHMSMDGFTEVLRSDSEFTLITAANKDVRSYGSIQGMLENDQHPYALKKNKYSYISFYWKDSLSEWAASYILKDWLEADQSGNMYLLLTEVYPFSDLELLRQISDQLYQAGIPFLVSTKPLFSNFDYPAAKRYAETLSYMQARNGSILIDAPTVSSQTISADLSILRGNIASYIDFLANHAVAPLGATAELYWFQDQYYLSEGLAFYDSAIILPNTHIMSNQPTNSLYTFPSTVYSLELQQWEKHANKSLVVEQMPMNIALTINMQNNTEEIAQQIEWLTDTWILFRDYKLAAHSVMTEQSAISSEQGVLSINGHALPLQDLYKEISSEHIYVDEKEASFKQLFTIQNKIFIVLIIVVLIVFAILLWIGYRLYRKKYRI